MRRWIRVLGALGVVAALMIGFVIGRSTASLGTTPPDGGSQLPLIPIPDGGSYVALGDSYSAGEGLPGYEAGTEDIPVGDRCHRSESFAFPLLLRFTHPPEVRHRACSGAVVANVFEVIQRHDGVASRQGLQVQTDTLPDSVALVTITMGGNDVRFADMLIFCAGHRSCVDDRFEGQTLADFAEKHLATVGADLTRMLTRLREQAPENARVLILGYPALFPESIPVFFAHPVCRTVFKFFGQSERTAIRGWNVQLDEEIQAAARTSGVEYVDVYSPFSQHEVCGAGGGWLKFVGNPSRQERDGWFHPTVTGQRMMARIVSCYLHVYRSLEQATRGDPADAFEMSACVADAYPTGGVAAPISIPTPSPVTS